MGNHTEPISRSQKVGEPQKTLVAEKISVSKRLEKLWFKVAIAEKLPALLDLSVRPDRE